MVLDNKKEATVSVWNHHKPELCVKLSLVQNSFLLSSNVFNQSVWKANCLKSKLFEKQTVFGCLKSKLVFGCQTLTVLKFSQISWERGKNYNRDKTGFTWSNQQKKICGEMFGFTIKVT